MTVQIRGTKKHDKHRMHVSTWQTPNWFEWLFMFRRKSIVDYVGKGTKWFVMKVGFDAKLQYTPVKSKSLIEILKQLHP